MAKLMKLVWSMTTMTFLTSCTTVIVQPAESKAQKPPEILHPAFTVEGDSMVHVVGALEDGRQTVVVFDSDKYAANIAGPNGEPIAYARLGNYAVINETYDGLTVWFNGHRAELKHFGPSNQRDGVQLAALGTGISAAQPLSGALVQLASTGTDANAAAPPTPLTPTGQTWQTTAGLTLRSQIRRWIEATGEEYHLVDRELDDPPEPDWRVTEEDNFSGDFLDALTWLRDGFWQAPRPDVIVTANKRIVLHSLGAAQ